MKKNIITIKQKPKQRISRRNDGSAVVRVRDEAADAVEKLVRNIDGEINLIDIISELLIFAVENTEINMVEGD